MIGWLLSALLRRRLHLVRVECAYCHLREFPMAGGDVLNIMAANGLCTPVEADAAIAEARRRIIGEEGADPWAQPLEDQGARDFHEERIPF